MSRRSIAPEAPPEQLRPDLDLLSCPACLGALRWSEAAVDCISCGRRYERFNGHPALVVNSTQHEEARHLESTHHKRQQASYYDRAQAEEFEIVRPHGTPKLYGWLLDEKFRRSLGGPLPVARGATVLTVCAGSGMDAEFLARRGFNVIAADISRQAVLRTAERARRFGLNIFPLLADIEDLPFRDGALDLVYVHDGLHHLEQPFLGLAEMARVGRSVSITEPAQAALTAAAVNFGLAHDREPAGNRVYRFTLGELAGELRKSDFKVIYAERYAMYYRHEPGRIFRALSAPPIFPLVRTGYRLANRSLGRWGNKLTIQAVRSRATFGR